MSTTSFLAFGADILENPNVSSNSNGGQDGAGLVRISGGTQIFASDYVIEFDVINVLPNGEFDGSSAFTGLRVYATTADYLAGNVLYTYTPQNPGQTASIQQDLSGIGDTYVRFNANVLVSSDAGAPTLSTLFVAPGTGIASKPGTTVINRHEDVDYNDSGTIDGGIEDGNGFFNTGNSVNVCYVAGTSIYTDNGPVPVEHLRAGDMIQTMDHGMQPLVWHGSTRLGPLDLMSDMRRLPVAIALRAVGPNAQLRVSRQHRMLDQRGFFVKAKDIIEMPKSGARLARGVRDVIYHHLLLPVHCVIFANGLASESFYPGPQAIKAVDKGQRRALTALLPDILNRPVAEVYGPLARPMATSADLTTPWQPVPISPKPMFARIAA